MGYISIVFVFASIVTVSGSPKLAVNRNRTKRSISAAASRKPRTNNGYDPHVYELYENNYDEYEVTDCESDAMCLEPGQPYCVSGKCQQEPPPATGKGGAALHIGGRINRVSSNTVAMTGDCQAAVGTLPLASTWGAAAVYDNMVYQCGGNSGSHSIDKCFIRTVPGQWSEGPKLNTINQGLTLNKVGTQLVAIGGQGYKILDSVLILRNRAWELQSYTISPARTHHCAVTVSTTQVMIVGGYTPDYINTTEMLNVKTGVITKYSDLLFGLYGLGCVLHQGKVIAAGGWTFGKAIGHVFILDYSNPKNYWATHSSLAIPRYWFTMLELNGVLTVYGGDTTEKTMEQYVGGAWKTKEFTATRYGHTTVLVLC